MSGLSKTLAVLAAAFLASCSPPAEYLASDAETYQVIAPEYISLVRESNRLTMEQKINRALSVDAWRIRTDRALNRQTPQLPDVVALLPTTTTQPTVR